MRFKDPVAELPQDLDGIGAHIVVVLDDENTLFAPYAIDLADLVPFFDFAAVYYSRQIDLDRRPFIRLRVNLYVTARLFDEAIHHRQPEPSAFADPFRREERIENPREGFFRHSGSRVGHGDDDVVAWRDFRVRSRVLFVKA